MELARIFTNITLTADQQRALDMLEGFLQDRSRRVFVLCGYAGTGKTLLLKGVADYLEKIGRQFVLAAPTGKAAKVLASRTGREAYTVHKTI